jgi:predicted ATP-dependent endonuclease of OLD family
VLVFEEPGIHLHPDAQDDLKGIVRDKVAEQCQVVYTTHLPSMYDLAYPEGCRAVMIDPRTGVTLIESQYSPNHQYATWEVAMRALGITNPVQGMLNRNIIVEGPADWVYLLTFAQLLASEETRLNGVASGLIHIHPCRGASSIPGIVPFFFQPGVKSVVVLDSDQPGKSAKDKLEAQFNPPNDYISGILMINEVVYADSKEHELEDLLSDDYYALLVTETIGQNRKISAKDFKRKNCIGAEAVRLVKEKYGIKLDKDKVAWHFRERVLHGDEKVDEQVMTCFKKLLLKVTETLGVPA